MTDDVKQVLERFRSFGCRDASTEADFLALARHIDGEPARQAAAVVAAREDGRKAGIAETYYLAMREESAAERPTAVYVQNAALRARVAELEKMLVFAGTGQRGGEAVATIERLEKAEARVAELEALLVQDREHVEMMSRERRDALDRAVKALEQQVADLEHQAAELARERDDLEAQLGGQSVKP